MPKQHRQRNYFRSSKKLCSLCFLLFLSITFGLQAQSKRLDSLKTAVSHIKEDTLKTDLYNAIALEYIYRKPDSACYYIDSLRIIGERYKNLKALAMASNREGVYFMVTGEYSGAITALSKARRYFSTMGDTISLAGVYNNLGGNDFYMKNYISSLSNYKTGLSKIDRFKNPEIYSTFLMNLSEVYREMNKLDSAYVYAEQSIAIAKRLNNDRRLAISYFNMGAARFEMQRYPEALDYLNQALDYDQITLQYELLAKIYKIGSLVALDRLGEAKVQLKTLEAQVIESQDKMVIMQLYQLKRDFYQSSGRFEEALQYAKKYQELDAEIRDLDQTKIRENLKIKFTISQKDTENNLLRREAELNNLKMINQRNIIWGVGVFIFILMVLLLFMSRLYDVNRKANTQLRSRHKLLNRDNKNLEKINIQKNNLFSIVAHDVKSPLGAIMTSINMLKDNINNFNEQELSLLTSELSRQTEGLYNLLDGVLTWAKSQMDGYKFNRKSLYLFKLIKELEAVEKQVIVKKELEFISEVPQDFEVWGDTQILGVVLRNLVNNAIKFTPPGGIVKVEVEKNDTESRISVIDNGLGMGQEKINQIFVKRERYTRKGTNDEEGNGIGLILCSEIANAMGGGIEVKSTVGRGSVFTLIIPNSKNQISGQ